MPARRSRGWTTISRKCPPMCAARRPPRSTTWVADTMEGAVAGSMTPLTAAEFEQLMAPFAPFEAAPHLAVACSGGGDSMALVILADRWVRARGGGVTALIVDHRLRPESAREAANVGRTLAELGIAHHILVYGDAPPGGNLEDR